MTEDMVMRIYDFKVLLEPEESGGYVAVCPALPGCYSQGDTVAEAMANIKEAIELCLEDMRAERRDARRSVRCSGRLAS